MRLLRPTTCAKWIGLAYAAGVACFNLAGVRDAPELILGAPLLWAWQVGPAALAAMLVKAARSPFGAWCFVAVEALVVASTLWLAIETQVHRDSWTAVGASMTLVFAGPVAQYAGVLLALGAARLLGWRPRQEWLEA